MILYGRGYLDNHTLFKRWDICADVLSFISTISTQLVAGSINVIAWSVRSSPLAMVTAGLFVGNDTVRNAAMSEITETVYQLEIGEDFVPKHSSVFF